MNNNHYIDDEDVDNGQIVDTMGGDEKEGIALPNNVIMLTLKGVYLKD